MQSGKTVLRVLSPLQDPSIHPSAYRTTKRKANPAIPNPAAAMIALLKVLFWSAGWEPCLPKKRQKPS